MDGWRLNRRNGYFSGSCESGGLSNLKDKLWPNLSTTERMVVLPAGGDNAKSS